MVPACFVHLTRYMPGNRHRNLWTGQCFSSWRPLLWFRCWIRIVMLYVITFFYILYTTRIFTYNSSMTSWWVLIAIFSLAVNDCLHKYCLYGLHVHCGCFLNLQLWIFNCYHDSLSIHLELSFPSMYHSIDCRIWTMMAVFSEYELVDILWRQYTNVSAITHLPLMCLPLDPPWQYQIELVGLEIYCIVFGLCDWLFCGVFGAGDYTLAPVCQSTF